MRTLTIPPSAGREEVMELIREKRLITKKPHKCFGCEREFPKGTEMKHQVWADDGSAYNSYLCETCCELVSDHALEFGGYFEYGEGELKDEAIEAEARFKKLQGGER